MDTGMSVTVGVNGLVDTLRRNRVLHQKEYEDALHQYLLELRILLVEKCEVALQAVSAEELDPSFNSIQLQKPASYLESYNRVIGMLEMTVETKIEIDEDQYREYVMDEWGWSHNFKSLNATYANH